MSKVLKWILYILLGLVALAVIVGVVFAFFGWGHGFYMMRPGLRYVQPYHYNNFYPGRMIFGGLFGLGIFLLVIIGIVALISYLVRGNRPAQMTSSSQVPAANQITPTPQEPVATPATTRACSNCGKPAQDDWTTCPYCGHALT
jgi:uncharacterized membrane protein